MRIISDFHDYYDCIQATGQDQSLLYLRRPTEESFEGRQMPFGDLPIFYTYRSEFEQIKVRQFAIGFCGKVYPLLRLGFFRSGEHFESLCYTMDDVESFMEKALRKRDFKDYEHKDRWRRRGGRVLGGRNRMVYKEFFEKWAEKNSFQNLFDGEKKVPIFVAYFGRSLHDVDRKIVYNGCLKDLQFYRILDAFTVFQELQMYWGNVAQPNRPIPEVSDEDLAAAKGFDKWSFRKEPTKQSGV